MSQSIEHFICFIFSSRECCAYLEEILGTAIWVEAETPRGKFKMYNVIDTLNCVK